MDLKRSPGGYFCYSEYTILWGRPVGREREAPPRKSIQFTKKSQLGRLGQKTAATGQGAVVWASLGQSDQGCASSVADHCCSCVSLNMRVSVVFSVLSILSRGRPSMYRTPTRGWRSYQVVVRRACQRLQLEEKRLIAHHLYAYDTVLECSHKPPPSRFLRPPYIFLLQFLMK